MKLRHILSWKTLFYELALPALRRLGPRRCDSILTLLGRASLLWPGKRRALIQALRRARWVLRTDWDPKALRPELAANAVRFLARDYPLDVEEDAEVFSRFDVTGFEPLEQALAERRGAILVGCHLGAHISGVHWLYRRGVPLRMLVQRPRHVSHALDRQFDRDEPHLQSSFFLRRDLTAGEATERLLRARAALRDGLAVYLAGDIPWTGQNSRPGRLVGQYRKFLSVWTDLATITGVPVFFVFCNHLPGGRYALRIDAPRRVASGKESEAVTEYLARLDAEIGQHPTDAVAHLLWPCYGPPHLGSRGVATRPSRRVATIS
ncbi:hypothetical protein [Singulisphaera sp. PoT]|uniref:LpxL/LpxP family acyltransferase n=1 Tax=Singulisphaera sp. PoT TaxID=3411797 RepID=UPI003BF4720D